MTDKLKIKNQKSKINLLIIFFLGVIKVNSICAENAGEIIKNVKETFRNAGTVTSDFKQIINNVSLKNKQTIYGIFKVKKPHKLLMTYEKPAESRQKVIINKNDFLIYLESSNQLIKRKIQDTQGELEKQVFPWLDEIDNFNISVSKKKDFFELNIIPKENAHEKFKNFLVHVNPKDWTVNYTYMLDLSNNIIEFYFSEIKFNKNISDKEFEFIPPKDAEIIEN